MSWFQRLRKACVWTVADPDRSAASGSASGPANLRTGLWGEAVAVAFLTGLGMRIIARREKVYRDEIDVIAVQTVRETEMLVFVEVKTRASDRFGGGRAALDARKRHALCRAAAHYLRGRAKTPFRFDLIEVVGRPGADHPPIIRHFQHAFPMETRFLHGALHRRSRRSSDSH